MKRLTFLGKWQWSNWTIGIWWYRSRHRSSISFGLDLLCFEGVWNWKTNG